MKTRRFVQLFLVMLCTVFFVCANLILKTSKAYAWYYLPQEIIDNIYKESTGKFVTENLDALAATAGYSDINALLSAAEGGEVKTSEDFGEAVVKFGRSAIKDNEEELAWIPSYLSQSTADEDGDGKNDVVLTLWLATSKDYAIYSDGTYCMNETVDPPSNNYSTTKLRAVELNNGGIYCTEYGGYSDTTPKKVEYTPTSNGTNKFEMYTTGALANYITVPANVEWQATAKKFKNDPLWAGGSLGYYTPSGWLNDKVWLPSIYEVFDRTVADNSGQTLRFSGDGGLWELSDDERKNYAYSWLRTAYPFGYCSYMFHLTSPGTNVDYVSYVNSTSCTIRPALHLNLSKAVKNSAPSHTHQFGEWNITIPATCADVGERTRTCSAEDCPLVNGVEKEEIPALGHDFAVDFTMDTRATCTHAGSKSRHCVRSDCSEKTDVTEIPIAAHEYTNYIYNNDATCLADGTKTAVCDYGCGTEDTITDVGTQLSHTWSTDWSKDGTNHWHECTSGCGTKNGEAVHSYTWVVDTPATITSTGIQHEECVCGERRSENTVIPVLTCSHTNKTHVAGVAATCMTAGTVEYWICGDCNKNIDGSGMEITDLVIPVDPAAHGYTNYVSDGNATCLADGTKTAMCSHGCGATDTVTDTGSKLAHAWSADWNKDTANHWHECMRGCGTKHGEATHAYNWVVDTPATMTSTGLKHEECVCGEKRSENTVIPVETCSHANKTHIAAVAATCVAAGNPEYWHCNDCNKNLDGSGLEISTLIIPIDPDAHNWGAWVQTVAPSYTADGEERRECQNTGCSHFETRTVSILNKAQAVISNFELNDLEYGDIIAPAATTSHGTVKFTYSNRLDGTYTATKPKNVGTYYVKASVEEGETYLGTEEVISFEITPREITVTINSGSSVLGAALETLTATVTSGSIVSGDDPYTLSTNADKDVLGTYAITGTCTDYNYSITFADGVYIVSQRASDPSGGGEIDIPTDIDVEFKVTQSSTSNSYSELAGLKKGYWAQLWYRNEDGTLGDEFTDKMNCMLTLKIPTDIIESIRDGEEINRDKIAAGLTVYYVDSDGDYIKIKPFTIAQKEDESWIIKFNYNEKFPAEIVFNAPDAEQEGASAKSGIPWWVWLLVGLGGATLITVIIVAVVLSKRKREEKTVTVQGGAQYDDAELKAKLTEQDRKLDEIKEIVDGGFNDFVDGE